ncbi:hypothetical protein HK16_09755 [Acetobacter senegalensis]|uniref:Helix-turn-helix domain-containing protein n=3 Tax=Acetobacteraceae TaxID=433 RepID=A0A252EMF4_9PROT|nr:helix-turn-helix domain-containing protein [Acetobacter tropicalis]OUL67588.1 hypothetical protein HK16_09755 [Acetobacter senegalensis]
MSFQAMAWAAKQDLKCGPKMVLMMLAHHADGKSNECHPSLQTLAQESGLSRRAVCRYCSDLEKSGLISRKGRAQNGAQISNIFTLNINEKVVTVSPTPVTDVHFGSDCESYPSDCESQGGCHTGTRVVTDVHTNLSMNLSIEPIYPLNPPTAENELVQKAEPKIIQPDSFDAFWDAYPRKVSKGHALKAWGTAIRKTPAAEIIRAVAETRWSRNPKFIPYPATWLNGERWNDRDIGARSVSEIIRDRAGSFIPAPLPEWGTMQ